MKGNALLGVFWGRFTTEEPDRHRANFQQLVSWVEDGTLVPRIQKNYPLSEGPDAMRWVADRKAIGKVIINP